MCLALGRYELGYHNCFHNMRCHVNHRHWSEDLHSDRIGERLFGWDDGLMLGGLVSSLPTILCTRSCDNRIDRIHGRSRPCLLWSTRWPRSTRLEIERLVTNRVQEIPHDLDDGLRLLARSDQDEPLHRYAPSRKPDQEISCVRLYLAGALRRYFHGHYNWHPISLSPNRSELEHGFGA